MSRAPPDCRRHVDRAPPLPRSSNVSVTSSRPSTTSLVPRSPRPGSSRRSADTSTTAPPMEASADGPVSWPTSRPSVWSSAGTSAPSGSSRRIESKTSEVEVRFVALTPERTRLELEHRHLDRHGPGWESLRDGAVDSGGGMAALPGALRGPRRRGSLDGADHRQRRGRRVRPRTCSPTSRTRAASRNGRRVSSAVRWTAPASQGRRPLSYDKANRLRRPNGYR